MKERPPVLSCTDLSAAGMARSGGGETIAVVTGGASGIGHATATALAKRGFKVIVADKDEERLAQAAESFLLNGLHVSGKRVDVTNAHDIGSFFAWIDETYGSFAILVNNAAINIRSEMGDCDDDMFRRLLEVNTVSVFSVSRRAVPLLRRNGSGAIVNVSSVLAFLARPSVSGYIASKGAVTSLTRAMAIEFSPEIRVNAVAPGYIRTEAVASLFDDRKFRDRIVDRTPLGRWGKPEEIAETIAFLCSSSATFINGQVIVADGGLSISL